VLEKAREDGFVEEDAAYWEMLANSWLLARELDRALEPLKTGAEISEEGNLYARLGQLYLEREQWKEASEALKSAIEKGGLQDESTTHLLLAISLYHQKRYQESIRNLRVARQSETETVRKSANQWLLLVDRDAQALRDAQFEEAPPAEAEEAMEEDPAPQPEQAAEPENAPQVEEVSQAP